MTVFKTFLKVLKSYKVPIIMYTVILILFAGFNMQTSDTSPVFVATKPDILIVNDDQNVGLTKNLVSYLKKHNNIIDIKDDEEAINDALFYRDVNYIVYIPKNYREDFLDGKNPEIKIKSTGDYQASLTNMQLERYLKVSDLYRKITVDEKELITNINSSLEQNVSVKVTSKLDTTSLEKATYYYNFANYSILAGCVYVICLILSSFKNEVIRKRTIISSMNYKEYNRKLLLSNSLFAIVLWILYVILSFVFVGDIMFTAHGLLYIINSFLFTFCAFTLAFFIGNLVSNKDAISSLVNVIALGSSFLCGAFVPMQYLPEVVLKIAHILPSYWYIKTNEVIKTLEIVELNTLKSLITNMIIIVGFSFMFICLTNIISKKKRKIT